jgi:ABC-type uncharacterized transport system substrate-binding protein
MQAPSIGGLMAYTVDPRDLMHRAAGYIDRILKGAKPAELAVQQPAHPAPASALHAKMMCTVRCTSPNFASRSKVTSTYLWSVLAI